MNREPRNDLEQRDIALARVLAEALKQRQAATDAAPSGETCPDAELLAAYAERTLDENEIARCENHFVECSRCRTILAVLTASAEEPLAAQEVRDFGERVGTAMLPGAHGQKVPRRSSHFPARWSWLVPAMGLAAGLALFFVLRPPRFAPAAPQTAMNQLAVKTEDSPSGNAPTKKTEQQPDREIAEAYIPAAPTAGVPAAPASGARNAAPDREAGKAPRDSFGARERTENKAKEETSASTPSPSSSQPPPPSPPRAQRELDAAAGSDRRALQSEAAQVNGPAAGVTSPAAAAPTPRPLEPAAQAKSAAPAAPAEPSNSVTPSRKALELRGQTQTQTALSSSLARAGLFASPDGKVSWRVSASGRIERSSDGGRNWQLQPTGVTSDLLSGVAASEQAAWVVGRAGVILRTTDGSRWERVSSPAIAGDRPAAIGGTLGGSLPVTGAVTEPDWIGVQAADALHATIVSSDAQRFHTDDGGRTWTRQP